MSRPSVFSLARAASSPAVSASSASFVCSSCSPYYSQRQFTRRLPPPTSSSSCTPRRHYASQSATSNLQVFNARTKLLQKERAAHNVERSRQTDYLRDEVALRLTERLMDINRSYDRVLDLGANACNVARAITQVPGLSSRIAHLTSAEASPTLLHRDDDLPAPYDNDSKHERVVLGSPEPPLPFAPESFDAVISSLSLHWVNDLPGMLRNINSILKPDAPFVAAMLGGDSLFELRTSLQLAELDRRGGVAPHVSPLADVRDVGGLLGGAGFKLLTVDVDDIIVEYPSSYALMTDLQSMGESNAVLAREDVPIQRDVLIAAEAIYRELHGEDESQNIGDDHGLPERGLPATFRIIYMIGWKEGPNQREPLARGTGETNLTDILGGGEIR